MSNNNKAQSVLDNNKNIPDPKYDRVSDSKISEETLPDGTPIQTESFTEAEIEVKNLIKIAPLYFYCPDNDKILMIPFSIQFTMTEFLQNIAKAAGKTEEILQQVADARAKKEEDKKNAG